jgi:prophage regulatory protein
MTTHATDAVPAAPQAAPIFPRMMRLPEVMRATGLKRSQIYELSKIGAFPRPIRVGLRAVAWIEDEIAAWLAERRAERDRKAAMPRDPTAYPITAKATAAASRAKEAKKKKRAA